jgi:hypothetical protein
VGNCLQLVMQAEQMLQHKTRTGYSDAGRHLVGPSEGNEILLPIAKLDQYFVPGLLDNGKHLPTHGMCGVSHSYFSDPCF